MLSTSIKNGRQKFRVLDYNTSDSGLAVAGINRLCLSQMNSQLSQCTVSRLLLRFNDQQLFGKGARAQCSFREGT